MTSYIHAQGLKLRRKVRAVVASFRRLAAERGSGYFRGGTLSSASQ